MLKKITENVEIHQTLPDTPNLTSEELKKEWDKGSKIIKDKFNELIDLLNNAQVLELKEKVELKELFASETGVDSCQLSESSENFDFLDIVFKATGKEKVERVYSPNTKSIGTQIAYKLDNLLVETFSKHTISGKDISAVSSDCGYLTFNSAGAKIHFDSTNYNKIIKVYGGKILKT